MRKTVSGLAVATMSVLGLSGCGGGSTEEFCALDERVDLADIDDFDELQDALDDGVDAAPDEIKDDVETVRDTLNEVVDRLEDEGVDSMSDITPEQQEALTDLDTEEFQQASENITQFTEDNCGSADEPTDQPTP
jgi:ElaB/YqjD/DUF883 family membrane-anchored ribosome-binding protein